MLVTVRVLSDSGKVEATVRVGLADTPEEAIKKASKRAREIESGYSKWSNFEYTYGDSVLARQSGGQVTLLN